MVRDEPYEVKLHDVKFRVEAYDYQGSSTTVLPWRGEMECRGRPRKSYAEREESVSESGKEGRRAKKRPSNCRAGGDLISGRTSVWGPLTKAPHEHGWVLLVAGGSEKFSLRVFVLVSFLFRSRSVSVSL